MTTGKIRQSSAAGWLAVLGVILLLTIAACSTDDESGQGDGTPKPTKEAPDSGGSEMRLTANGCTADCTFASDEEFTLAVEIVAIPAGGYIAAQSFIDYGADLTYEATAAVDEIVWSDCDSAIALSAETGPTFVNHGCLTGLIQPLPVSFYVGNLVEMAFRSSSGSSNTEVRLLPEGEPAAITSGAAFVGEDAVTLLVPEVTDLTIICEG